MMAAQFPEFKDRAVLVTGGGSGIGAAIVEGFARQGAKVSFIDIAEAAGRELAERLSRETAHPVSFHHTDLRDIEAIRRTVDSVIASSGPIRVLVNNAAWDDRHE
ncbi:SDR family NAD(P)-dependent oxidoreductase, partial [Rhizobium ruizarguesonis]